MNCSLFFYNEGPGGQIATLGFFMKQSLSNKFGEDWGGNIIEIIQEPTIEKVNSEAFKSYDIFIAAPHSPPSSFIDDNVPREVVPFKHICNECCGAGPFLTGSGSRYFFSPAPAPAPIKSRLWAIQIFFLLHTYFLARKNSFMFKYLFLISI